MKTEHRDIIERAKRHNMLPMDIAHELMVHDLVEAALFEVRNVRAAYHSLNEGQQQEGKEGFRVNRAHRRPATAASRSGRRRRVRR